MLEKGGNLDPGFVGQWGYFLGQSPRSLGIASRLQDIGEQRIRDMDSTGIARQILSLTNPGVQIFDAVTKYYGVRLSDLQSKRRHKSIAFPRQVCMYLARRHTRYSLEEIGGYFGGRDHTTVMHAVKTVDGDSKEDVEIARQVTHIESQLTGAQ